MGVLLALHLAGLLVAGLVIAASAFAVSRIGSLLGELDAPAPLTAGHPAPFVFSSTSNSIEGELDEGPCDGRCGTARTDRGDRRG